MLRVFRNIRLRLIDRNRVMGYLIYALGEIVLVVIGILIALQINDWSDRQKLRKTNVKMMERLQDEMRLNVNRLNYLDTILEFQGIKIGFSPILQRLDTAIVYINDGLNEEKLKWMLEEDKFFDGSMYNLSNAVYRELLSSGRFYALGSDSLINNIQIYYQLIDREEQYAKSWNMRAEEFWRECKFGYNELLADYKVVGDSILVHHKWYLDQRSTEYINLKFALRQSRRTTERNRRHARNMIAHSESLIAALEAEKEKKP